MHSPIRPFWLLWGIWRKWKVSLHSHAYIKVTGSFLLGYHYASFTKGINGLEFLTPIAEYMVQLSYFPSLGYDDIDLLLTTPKYNDTTRHDTYGRLILFLSHFLPWSILYIRCSSALRCCVTTHTIFKTMAMRPLVEHLLIEMSGGSGSDGNGLVCKCLERWRGGRRILHKRCASVIG